MEIVALQGDIFSANAESYIISEWETGFDSAWRSFLERTLGNAIRFRNSHNEEVPRDNAFTFKGNVLTLTPPLKEPEPWYRPLKFIYFIRKDGHLKERLFEALDALNDKRVARVAFNGDLSGDDKTVKDITNLLNSWERKKLEDDQEQVSIKQVYLVSPDDYFVKNFPPGGWSSSGSLFRPIKYTMDNKKWYKFEEKEIEPGDYAVTVRKEYFNGENGKPSVGQIIKITSINYWKPFAFKVSKTGEIVRNPAETRCHYGPNDWGVCDIKDIRKATAEGLKNLPKWNQFNVFIFKMKGKFKSTEFD